METKTTRLPGHPAVAEWRVHWRVGLAALVGSGLSYSVWINLSSLFVLPFQERFGWSRGEIALAHNASLLAALLAPACGRLIDQVGVRRVLLTGLTCTALVYLLMSQMSGALWQFYLLQGAAAVFGLTTTGLAYTRVVCAAFEQTRGLALAVTRGGLAVTSAVLPLLLHAVMAAAGWRLGIAVFGGLMLCIALPVVAWAVPRDRPAAPPVRAATVPLSRDGVLRSRKVVTLCLAAALAYVPLLATFSQLQPLLVGKHLEPAQASGIVGLIGVAALVGALLSGLLLDRLWAPLVALCFTLAPACGLLLLLGDTLTPGTASAAVLLIGVGYGAESDLLAYMAARYFGLSRYATIYGFAVLCIGAGTSMGISAIGLGYDRFGSYELALQVGAGMCVAAALGYLSLGRYPARLIGPTIRGAAVAVRPTHETG